MDKDRQIRFLYSPLIFLLSLSLGLGLDYPDPFWDKISILFTSDNKTSIVVALFGLGSLVIVLGYLIGTITILLLRLVFFFNGFSYEFNLSEKTYEKIGKLILRKKSDTIQKHDKMYAAVVFDHSYIHEKIHSWIARRWNAFLIASFSVVALVASLFCGHSLGIGFTRGWVLTIIIFCICFILQGTLSWIETMKMVTFLTRVKKNDDSKVTDARKDKPKVNYAD
ncbi:MAG: hypothetical protein AABY93_16625 [Bacteroidota bacterium]